jgi:general secretion pathway protein D
MWRLLALNKQLANIHIDDQLSYETASPTAATPEVKTIPIGTQLQVKPFVAADEKIRLEVFAERSTGRINSNGIPEINAVQIATNLMMSDGATVVMGGPTHQ